MLPSTMQALQPHLFTRHTAKPVCSGCILPQSAPQSSKIARISSLPQQSHQEQWHQQQTPLHTRTRRDRFRRQVAADHGHSSSLGEAEPATSMAAPVKQTIAQDALLTWPEVQQIAEARGLHISLKNLGPFYRIVCRDGKSYSKCNWLHN